MVTAKMGTVKLTKNVPITDVMSRRAVSHMPTAKQIARELGVSKQTVLKKLDDLGLRRAHAEVVDGRGTLAIDHFAAAAIADALTKAERTPERPEKSRGSDRAGEVWREYAEALKSRLSAADAEAAGLRMELEKKNLQIERMQDQIDRQQSTIDALANRSWLDRILGRGLPAPTDK